MKRIVYTLFIGFIFLSIGCGRTTYQPVVAGDEVAFEAPSYMEAFDMGHETALIQMGNHNYVHYLILTAEPESDFEALNYKISLEKYAELIIEYMEGISENIHIERRNSDLSSEFEIISFEANGMVDDLGIVYRIIVFKGEKTFYALYTWTNKGQETKLNSTMNHIIQSLKPIST